MKFGLNENTIQKIQSVFYKYPQIQQVIIYGSRAKGNYKNGSDIDLCLKSKNLNFKDLLKIETLLDELMLPYKIDICIYDEIKNEDLKEHIQRIGEEFFS